jgi:uncharacterized RDD family membrane protein YckC
MSTRAWCPGCSGPFPGLGVPCPKCGTSVDDDRPADAAGVVAARALPSDRGFAPGVSPPPSGVDHHPPATPPPTPPEFTPPATTWMPIAPMGGSLPPWGDGPPATFGQRLGARLIDTFVVTLYTVVLWVVLGASVLAFGTTSGALVGLLLGPLLIVVMTPVINLLYFQLSETRGGRTLGRSAMGIRLVNANAAPGRTDRVGGWQALGRRIVQGLGDFVIFLGSLSMLWAPDRRTWADKAGNTAVIQSRTAPGPARSVKASAIAVGATCALIAVGVGVGSAQQPTYTSSFIAHQPPVDTGGTTTGSDSSAPPITTTTVIDPSQSAQVAVSAQVPAQSADGVDKAGNPTTYGPENMLDGDPATAWRMDGDGSGSELYFDLGGSRTLTAIRIINGYAKTDPASGENRYLQERRTTAVTWIFGDGTQVQQSYTNTRRFQRLELPSHPVTSHVTMRIDATSGPGEFDPNYDFTALSEVDIEGQ